jgi:hypothetical protein
MTWYSLKSCNKIVKIALRMKRGTGDRRTLHGFTPGATGLLRLRVHLVVARLVVARTEQYFFFFFLQIAEFKKCLVWRDLL